MIDEFLAKLDQVGYLGITWKDDAGPEVLFHGHCHQKALVGSGPTLAVLNDAGYDVSEVDSGCCGMAGSFGFEKEHYDVSLAIGNRRLAPAVKAAGAAVEIIAPGISCRQQIEHLTGRSAKHPAEALWEALNTGLERTGGRQ
jgi:Fe-S oxidoreductase